jgi:uncharacterized protein YjbI with pentapeptide repeats
MEKTKGEVMKKLSKSELIELLETDIGAFNQYREDIGWKSINISGADLRWTDLRNTDLSGANLYGVELKGVDLSGADLKSANLMGADLSWADLSGADLSGADLLDTNLFEACLRFTNLFEADLRFTNLRSANLYCANLYRANLYRANLYGVDLSGADLRFANLMGAELRGADLRGADLNGADLNDTKGLLSNEDLLDKYFDKAERSHFVKAEHSHWIVYKAFGNTSYPQPDHWKLEPGNIIEEINLNDDRREDCGSGVNFATLEWIEGFYGNSMEIWKCEVREDWGLTMPYVTDGKGRSRKLKLIEIVK